MVLLLHKQSKMSGQDLEFSHLGPRAVRDAPRVVTCFISVPFLVSKGLMLRTDAPPAYLSPKLTMVTVILQGVLFLLFRTVSRVTGAAWCWLGRIFAVDKHTVVKKAMIIGDTLHGQTVLQNYCLID